MNLGLRKITSLLSHRPPLAPKRFFSAWRDAPLKTIHEVVRSPMIMFTSSTTVESALELLEHNNISSAPVVELGKVLGFVDDMDLMCFLVQKAMGPSWPEILETTDALMRQGVGDFKKKTKEYRLQHVTSLMDVSKRNPYFALSEDLPFSDALDVMKVGVHRIAVHAAGKDAELTGILTQSASVRHLWFHKKDISIFKKPVSVSKVPYKKDNVATIEINSYALDAFVRLYKEQLTSLAVTDNGQLVGVVNASDVHHLFDMDFELLLSPLNTFLAMVRLREEHPKDFVLTCEPEESFTRAVEKMVRWKAKHIYVVGPLKEPLSVISLTDIIRYAADLTQ